MNAGLVATAPYTWGDRLLGRMHHRTRLESMTQTMHMGFDGQLIDGELYTADCRRGNIRARVIAGGRVGKPIGSVSKLHPFAKGAVRNQYSMRMYQPVRGKGDSEPANTLVQGPRLDAVATG